MPVPGQGVLLDAGMLQKGAAQQEAAQQLDNSRVQEVASQLHVAAEEDLGGVGAALGPRMQPAQVRGQMQHGEQNCALGNHKLRSVKLSRAWVPTDLR